MYAYAFYQAYAFATIVGPIFRIEKIGDKSRQKIASNNGRRVCKCDKDSKYVAMYCKHTYIVPKNCTRILHIIIRLHSYNTIHNVHTYIQKLLILGQVIHAHIHAHIHTYIHTYIHKLLYLRSCIRKYIHTIHIVDIHKIHTCMLTWSVCMNLAKNNLPINP